jgi:ABC-type sugar transport system ATPase subunit
MTSATDIEPPAADVVLAARNIAKSYGSTQALKGVKL